uniref:C-X-C motif chemokine 11-1 n=1 Tax=Fundulus heteroclitus TaxID=8078 RepID=A0A3Q2TIT5_FUNHE
MNSAIQCIVLLACITVCTSASKYRCQCPQTTEKPVKSSLIHDVKIYEPRPYCSSLEVIVILKNKRQVCLNPESKFTKALLDHMKKQK